MKTRNFFLLFAFVLSMNANLYTQVTIGGMDIPKTGAILDLNSTVKGGLVLSNVSLSNLYTIPDGSNNTDAFPGISKPSQTDKDAFKGALVYNTNPTWGVGIYIWNGTNWTPAGENCKALTQLNLTPSPLLLAAKGDKITFFVSSGESERCAKGEKYTWFLNNSPIITDGLESSQDIEFTTVGTYEVEVSASNRYADPSSKVSSNKTTVQVSTACPGVIIPDGAHVYDTNTEPDAVVLKTFPDGTTYGELSVFHKLSPAKDLCVYYRDAKSGSTETFQWWSSADPAPYEPASDQYAITLCKADSDVGVDAVDRSSMEGWRLPNIAELGQMSSAAVAKKVNGASIQFDKLEEVAGRDTRSKNMISDLYWSSTEYDASNVIAWKYDGTGTKYDGRRHGGYRVRCVRTME